jgi:phage recombination protein Bet
MTTELATREHVPTTELAISPEQTTWNDKQLATLRHLGVEAATEADLGVFFHECARTGLDPFTRQIYMIGRWSQNGTKYTIQTGIDGYRLIGRRAATERRETISLAAPQWANNKGEWLDVWSKHWGAPLAARITIHRHGQPFTAVALYDEYAQTKRDGTPTQMWAQRPAGQLAKCAEALVWRMAFPQDLSGLYTSEEMAQADNETPVAIHQPVSQQAPAATAGVAVRDVKKRVVEYLGADAAAQFWKDQGLSFNNDTLMTREDATRVADLALEMAEAAKADEVIEGELVNDTNDLEQKAADLFDTDGGRA